MYTPHMRPASASASAIWCAMLAPAYNPNDCLAGQDYNTCTVVIRSDVALGCSSLSKMSSDQLKRSLINNLNYFSSSGQPFQQYSADWIDNALGPNWQTYIMASGITLRVESYSFNINRAYNPGPPPSIVSYPEIKTTTALVIYSNGVPIDKIKLNCGNMVGTHMPIPQPTQKITISGAIYFHNNSNNSNKYLSSVNVIYESCNTGSTSVNTNGSLGDNFSIPLKPGSDFCVSVPSTYTATDGTVYSKPVITPGYILGSTSPPSGAKGDCNGFNQWYRGQIAGSGTNTSAGFCNYGITDNDYNIAYQSANINKKCTSNCCSILSTCPVIVQPCTLPASGQYPEPETLPNAPNPGGASVPSSSSSEGSVFVLGTPGGFQITSAYDQYQPNPTTITWTPWSSNSNTYFSNPFTLNYYNYIAQYPYDDHATTINYTQEYTMQEYIADTPIYNYYCSGGGTPMSCAYTVQTPSGCTGTACTSTTEYGTLEEYTTYGYSPVGSTYQDLSFATTSGPAFPEWCPRNFEVLPPTNTDVNGVSIRANKSTPDQPNSVTINTQTTVYFDATAAWWIQNAVRHPFSVNPINYTGNYYIEPASGGYQVPFNSPDNQTFNIVGTTSPGNVTYPYNPSFPVSAPPLQVGDQICAQFSDSPQSGQTDENGNITYINSYGPVNSSQIPSNNTCSNPVANYPYSRAYGNDVMTGTNFSGAPVDQCNSTASIIASISPDSFAQPRGSGTQFADLALGQIQNYASAFLRSATETAINGLSLANTTGGYGGEYSTACQPIYNYYLNRNQNLTPVPVNDGQTYGVTDNSGAVSLNFINNSGNYITLVSNSGNSDTKITGQHVIYINGNVFIPNNITYHTSSITYNASDGTVSNVPNLYVIASGNIYIGPNVTNLDGVYVAQSSCDWSNSNPCTGGTINTCSDPSGVASASQSNGSDNFPPADLFVNCTNQLVIRGSLVGHNVKLERTYASMRNSVGGENPLSGQLHDCSAGNGQTFSPPAQNTDCSAEVFNFDPLNYLGNPNFSANGYNIDSIISLPPVL